MITYKVTSIQLFLPHRPIWSILQSTYQTLRKSTHQVKSMSSLPCLITNARGAAIWIWLKAIDWRWFITTKPPGQKFDTSNAKRKVMFHPITLSHSPALRITRKSRTLVRYANELMCLVGGTGVLYRLKKRLITCWGRSRVKMASFWCVSQEAV